MSIKYKTPAIMMIVFTVNIIILLLFFQFYSLPYLSKGIEKYQAGAEQITSEISLMINGESLENGLEVLNLYAQNDNQINFTLLNGVTKEQINIPEKQSASWGFSAFESIELSGVNYTLFFRRDIGIIHSIDGTLYRLTVLELIVFAISFVVFCIIMHVRYVRPILRLKAETVNFLKSGTKLKPSNRLDELGELENSFYNMTEELSKEKIKQDRIIASISHDIKTPLTSILGFSERMIKKNLDKDKQMSYLKNIYTQGKNIENIIEDFDEYLSFSMNNNLVLKDVEISFICDLLRDEYTDICIEKGAVLSVLNNCPQSTKTCIDIAKFRRVFANLIGNSMRHNNVQELQISITFTVQNNMVLITVADNGKGVPEDVISHIFEPFYTSDQSRKVSGLGLSICEQIVSSHDGIINAQNTETGFEVKISLPIKQ